MSCESRHRAIITTLLTLAGLHDTAPVDEVMRVGVAHRRRRGGLPTPDAAVTVSLHADAQHALEITGHSDHDTPAWVAALIDRLHTAAERGSRRAFLTLRWLTGGWEEVTPIITEDDRAWIMIATRCGIRVPPACEAWLAATHPRATIGRLLAHPVRDAVVLTDLLDALCGIDDVSPDAAQTVTPLQVLRFLLGGSFPSRTDLQRVLRAVLTDAPVVRETIAQMDSIHGSWVALDHHLPYRLIGRAAGTHGHSVAQAGGDVVLTMIPPWIQRMGGPAIDPATLRDPSPQVVRTITSFLWIRRNSSSALAGLAVTALLHIWRTSGREDAVAEVVRTLGQVLTDYIDDRFVFPMTVVPIITGIIRPPHGDAFMAHLGTVDTGDRWSILVASAVYAAACHQIGYVPTIGGIDDVMRNLFPLPWYIYDPSPVPVLTVGQEQERLLPALRAARGANAWFRMLLDIIDAMDTIDMVGGDPQALQDVLADVLTDGSGTIDPQIIVRLAASRCGQAILADLPDAPIPPIRDWNNSDMCERVVPHLVSPRWATAPHHMYDWWKTNIEWLVTSRYASLLDNTPPLYPTVMPRVAIVRPTPHLAARAVAHRQWATLPGADRRACLHTVVQRMNSPQHILAIAISAATDTALHDIAAAVARADSLSDTDKDRMRQIIDPDAWGGQHEL